VAEELAVTLDVTLMVGVIDGVTLEVTEMVGVTDGVGVGLGLGGIARRKTSFENSEVLPLAVLVSVAEMKLFTAQVRGGTVTTKGYGMVVPSVVKVEVPR